jgi:hypothetical protein
VVYAPLRNRLTLLLEVSAQTLLSAAIAGAVGATISGSGAVAVCAAAAVVLFWTVSCLRVRLVLTEEAVHVVNRWSHRTIERGEIRGFAARHASRGLFGAGGKSFPLICISVQSSDSVSDVGVEVTMSFDRKERRRAVELMRTLGARPEDLADFIKGYV